MMEDCDSSAGVAGGVFSEISLSSSVSTSSGVLGGGSSGFSFVTVLGSCTISIISAGIISITSAETSEVEGGRSWTTSTGKLDWMVALVLVVVVAVAVVGVAGSGSALITAASAVPRGAAGLLTPPTVGRWISSWGCLMAAVGDSCMMGGPRPNFVLT